MLLSDGCNAKVLVSEGMNISYHPCISQVQKSVVYYGTVRGRGVKNGKVGVTRGRTIEIRVRKGASVEGGSISRGEFRAFSLQCNTISRGMIPDKFCDFLLSVFVDEDEGIVARVVGVVLMPSFPRVDDIFIIADGDV